MENKEYDFNTQKESHVVGVGITQTMGGGCMEPPSLSKVTYLSFPGKWPSSLTLGKRERPLIQLEALLSLFHKRSSKTVKLGALAIAIG
jgi:hypothetical protein